MQMFVSKGVLPTLPEELDGDMPAGYEEAGSRPLDAFGYGDLEGRGSELGALGGQRGRGHEGMMEVDDLLERV